MKNKKILIITLVIVFIVAVLVATGIILSKQMSSNKEHDFSKDDFFNLVDAGINNSSTVEAFIYDKKFFGERSNFLNIHKEDNYSSFTDIMELSKYKDSKYEFSVLGNTSDYIWVGFDEYVDNKYQSTTYMVLDKATNFIKSINSDYLQLYIP